MFSKTSKDDDICGQESLVWKMPSLLNTTCAASWICFSALVVTYIMKLLSVGSF